MSYTLGGLNTYEESIKKSRFVALAHPARSAAHALDFFAMHSAAGATHHCWAYQIGGEYRFNDDGEPGGTAGRPILQAIQSQECDQVAVMVVRWFGGVKLGPGGLMRAYGGVAAQCLRLAPKVELLDEVRVDCHCPFADLALVQSRFPAFQIRVEVERFDALGVQWRLAVPRAALESFAQLFGDLTRGQGAWSVH
jgi:putative IMPACT (imprinted ancient) family translation regulator